MHNLIITQMKPITTKRGNDMGDCLTNKEKVIIKVGIARHKNGSNFWYNSVYENKIAKKEELFRG